MANPKRPYPSLKAWREARGFSQEEAADFLEISQPYYSRLERRLQMPTKDILERLMARTSVPVESILGIAS